MHRLGTREEPEGILSVLDVDGSEGAARVRSDDYLDAFTIRGTKGDIRERGGVRVANDIDLPTIQGGFDAREALPATPALAPSTLPSTGDPVLSHPPSRRAGTVL